MKQVEVASYLYKCEFCGNTYDLAEEALDCEATHKVSTMMDYKDYEELCKKVTATSKKLDKDVSKFNSIVDKIVESQREYCSQCVNAYADKFISLGKSIDDIIARLDMIEEKFAALEE